MSLLARVLDLLYPERCPACDAFVDQAGLCARCASSLYPLGAACPRCAEPQAQAAGLTCARCLRDPPAFAETFAPWRYGGELAVTIRRWKYGGPDEAGRPELTRSLVPLFAPVLAEARRDVDLVVAVPLHPVRLRRRGFSPAARLLAACGARTADVLHRPRATLEQAGLSRRERAENVAGAFVADPLAGRVLLVDDVLTTGATAHAAARALLVAGAARVQVLVLARAEGSA